MYFKSNSLTNNRNLLKQININQSKLIKCLTKLNDPDDENKHFKQPSIVIELVGKFEHVQTSQLIEISFRFVEFSHYCTYNLLISRNQLQLNRQCNALFKSFIQKLNLDKFVPKPKSC